MVRGIDATLILVLGPKGSGKAAFARCFKNSFLRTFPLLSLEEGIGKRASFCHLTDLKNADEIALIQRAKDRGFKIVCYCLFAARILCQERNRFKELSKGNLLNSFLFREEYENFYDRVISLYPYLDMVFFVENQKYFSFVGVYNYSSVPSSLFEKALRKEKGSCDKIFKS